MSGGTVPLLSREQICLPAPGRPAVAIVRPASRPRLSAKPATAGEPASASPAFTWMTIQAGAHGFLRPLFEALGVNELNLWVESGTTAQSFTRTALDGVVTATAELEGRTVAIAWSDFRVRAASFGRANSTRFVSFLRQLRRAHESVPLIYVVNSAGLSLMEGRQVFSDAFGIWPELLSYSARNVVLTCATGKCLGLAPLLFGLGHYRTAVAGKTQINLTGPQVISLFFGETVDFSSSASAERFFEKNDLIHELVPSVSCAMQQFRRILSASSSPQGTPLAAETRTGALLSSFLDGAPQELFGGSCDRVRIYYGTRRSQRIGVFINPLERSNNMITVRTLDKYAAGLDLFRALDIPVVSFLDSPGIDPRFEQSDANNFRRMLSVGERIINYRAGTMGVITRRCFGGAATLSFPRVFGGSRMIALRGSRVGCMHESIIERQLSGSPNLLAEWNDVKKLQGPDLEDLLAHGSVDAVIDDAELPREIDRFLAIVSRGGARGHFRAAHL